MKRLGQSVLVKALPPALALVCAALLGMVIIASLRMNPFAVVGDLVATLNRSWGLRDDLGKILFYATPLIFTGLAVAVAFRAGLFNIGGPGQVMMGSLVCGLAGWKAGHLHGALAIPLGIAAAAAGGAAWGAIAGALKAWRGSHEVIITIMLNFCAVALADAVVHGRWANHDTMTPQLHDVGPGARLPRLGARASETPPDAGEPRHLGLPLFPGHVEVNVSLLLALLAAAGVWVFLFRTTRGYELRAVGLNPEAARAAGISVKRVTIGAMAISGALAGLAATDLVMGWKYAYRQDDAVSYGQAAFIGIAVSLMGQNHPAGVVLAALLFGALQHLGGQLSGVPKELVFILQAAVILFVICGNEIFRRFLAKRGVVA